MTKTYEGGISMLQKIRNGAIGIFALGVVSILVGINFKLTKIARRFMNNPDELIRYGIETEQHAIDVCNKLHEVYPTMTLRKLYANLNTMEIIGINMQIKGFAEKDKIHMTDENKDALMELANKVTRWIEKQQLNN